MSIVKNLRIMQCCKNETSLDDLKLPSLVTARLGGVNAYIRSGVLVTKSGKPLPNEFVRKALESVPELEGLDGELVSCADVQETVSVMLRREGSPRFTWYVLDCSLNPHEDAARRTAQATEIVARARTGSFVKAVVWKTVDTRQQLKETYEAYIRGGSTGIYAKRCDSRYKLGLSTKTEGSFLSVMNRVRGEGTLLDVTTRNRTMKVKDYAVALVVRCAIHDEVHNIGTGMSMSDRTEFLKDRDALVGKTVLFAYTPDERGNCTHLSFMGWSNTLE